MRFIRSLVVVLGVVLLMPVLAFAQDFEGVITERSLDLDDQDLFELLWAEAEDEPEFDDETEWFRYAAETLFQIPLERVVEGEGADVSEVTMWVKGSKVRYADSNAGSAGPYGLLDTETSTITMVMPETRSYIQYDMEEIEQETRDLMESMGIDPDEAADLEEFGYEDDEDMGGVWFEPVVRSLNRSEVVNGVQASAYRAEAGREIGLGWCADDVTGIRAAMAKMLGQMDAFEDEEESDSGPSAGDLLCETEIPVRTQILTFDAMAGGLWYSVTETLSVERTPVEDGMFEIPAGYSRRSFEEMWR